MKSSVINYKLGTKGLMKLCRNVGLLHGYFMKNHFLVHSSSKIFMKEVIFRLITETTGSNLNEIPRLKDGFKEVVKTYGLMVVFTKISRLC